MEEQRSATSGERGSRLRPAARRSAERVAGRITRDRPQDKSTGSSQGGAESDTSEPKGQELVYAARVSLDRTRMQVEDRLVDLAPGMAVTVEIKTESRRLIEYLLSPLLRYRQGSFRER